MRGCSEGVLTVNSVKRAIDIESAQSGGLRRSRALSPANSIASVNPTPTAGGSGWTIGDTFTVNSSGVLATGTVDAVTTGTVTAFHLGVSSVGSPTTGGGGSGYSTGSGKLTSPLACHNVGTCAGLTINITNVTQAYGAIDLWSTEPSVGFTCAVGTTGNSWTANGAGSPCIIETVSGTANRAYLLAVMPQTAGPPVAPAAGPMMRGVEFLDAETGSPQAMGGLALVDTQHFTLDTISAIGFTCQGDAPEPLCGSGLLLDGFQPSGRGVAPANPQPYVQYGTVGNGNFLEDRYPVTTAGLMSSVDFFGGNVSCQLLGAPIPQSIGLDFGYAFGQAYYSPGNSQAEGGESGVFNTSGALCQYGGAVENRGKDYIFYKTEIDGTLHPANSIGFVVVGTSAAPIAPTYSKIFLNVLNYSTGLYSDSNSEWNEYHLSSSNSCNGGTPGTCVASGQGVGIGLPGYTNADYVDLNASGETMIAATGLNSNSLSRATTLQNPVNVAGAPAITQFYTNDTSTGTANLLIAKLNGSNQVVKAGTTDTEAVGIVFSGGGTTGSAQVAIAGNAVCTFENMSTAGHYVQIGTTVAGTCHDAGASVPTSGSTILGRVADGGAAGNHNVAIAVTPPSGVTSFSGDGVLITNSLSTGAVTATLGNASAHNYWGNNTASSAAPGYHQIGLSELAATFSSPLSLSTNTLSVSCAAGQLMGGATPSCSATPTLGASGTLGSITMGNATSGTLTLEPVAGALGTVTMKIPAATDTLADLAGTQTLTNKTLITGTSGNSVTLLNVQGTLSPVTDGGAGVLTQIYTYSIPQGTMNANACIRATAFTQHTTGSSSATYKWAFGATSVPASASNTVTVAMQNFEVLVCNINNTSVQTISVMPSFTGSVNQSSLASGPVTAGAIATASGAVSITLEFSVPSGTGDQVTPESWMVELIQ